MVDVVQKGQGLSKMGKTRLEFMIFEEVVKITKKWEKLDKKRFAVSTAARAEQQLFLVLGLFDCIKRPTASVQEQRHMYVSHGTL